MNKQTSTPDNKGKVPLFKLNSPSSSSNESLTENTHQDTTDTTLNQTFTGLDGTVIFHPKYPNMTDKTSNITSQDDEKTQPADETPKLEGATAQQEKHTTSLDIESVLADMLTEKLAGIQKDFLTTITEIKEQSLTDFDSIRQELDATTREKDHYKQAFHDLQQKTQHQSHDSTPDHDVKHKQRSHSRDRELSDMRKSIKSLQESISDLTFSIPKQMPQTHSQSQHDISKLCNSIDALVNTVANKPPPTRGPQITLPKFNGALTSSFEKWAKDLEIGFNHLNWQIRDPQRCTILPTLLEGYARVTYDRIENVSRMSFLEVMGKLEEVFSIACKPFNVRFKHVSRNQRENETVRSYSADILQRIEDCKMEDKDLKLMTYLNGLLPSIKCKVTCMDYKNIMEAVICAEKAENAVTLEKQLTSELSSLSFRPSRRDRYQNKQRERSRSRPSRDTSYSRLRSNSRNRYRSQSRHRSQSREAARDNQYRKSYDHNKSYNTDPERRKRSSSNTKYNKKHTEINSVEQEEPLN